MQSSVIGPIPVAMITSCSTIMLFEHVMGYVTCPCVQMSTTCSAPFFVNDTFCVGNNVVLDYLITQE